MKWIEEDVSFELLMECTAIASKRKPSQRIPLGYLATIVEDQRTGGDSGVPDWARLPRKDDELERWAVKHQYPMPPRGMQTYREYRALLRNHIERRLNGQDGSERHADA